MKQEEQAQHDNNSKRRRHEFQQRWKELDLIRQVHTNAYSKQLEHSLHDHIQYNHQLLREYYYLSLVLMKENEKYSISGRMILTNNEEEGKEEAIIRQTEEDDNDDTTYTKLQDMLLRQNTFNRQQQERRDDYLHGIDDDDDEEEPFQRKPSQQRREKQRGQQLQDMLSYQIEFNQQLQRSYQRLSEQVVSNLWSILKQDQMLYDTRVLLLLQQDEILSRQYQLQQQQKTLQSRVERQSLLHTWRLAQIENEQFCIQMKLYSLNLVYYGIIFLLLGIMEISMSCYMLGYYY